MKEILFSFLTGYIFGSIPFAYIISKKFKNIDIRKVGDRNPGARNVYRNVGKFEGVLTFILDFLKGAVPVYFFYRFLNKQNLALISGFGVVMGHDFPLFLKFYGGKSISAIIGIFSVLFPLQMLGSFIFFPVFLKIKKHFDHAIAFSFILFFLLLIFTKVEKILIFYAVFLLISIGIKKLIDFPRERLMLR